ncbi:hypothetical protein Taro_038798, partial [Colocasia esculenta]|nr:hypothetical protein [Colocasia esculenta]
MASRRSPTSDEIEGIAAEADNKRLLSILSYLDDLHEMKSANWAATIHEYLISGVKAFVTAAASSKTIFLTDCVPALGVITARRTVMTRSRRSMSEWQFSELKEERKRGRKEEGDEKKRKEEAKKRKVEEEQRKRKEEKEKEAERKEEEEEEDQRKKKEEEEDQRKKKEEEEAESTRKEEEEEEKKRKRRQIFPSSLSRRVSVGTRIRRQPELYTPEDFRYHKATKVNVSTSEPIYVDSQESTDTLPRGKKEERQDYVVREVLGVAEKSLIERFLNECIINDDLMFNGTLEGYENFLSFNDIRELLFARESESVIIDCYINTFLFLPREENPDIFLNFGYLGSALKGYVQSCRDDKSKHQHFDRAFRKLDRAPNEFDLLLSPMHVGMNHWALFVRPRIFILFIYIFLAKGHLGVNPRPLRWCQRPDMDANANPGVQRYGRQSLWPACAAKLQTSET